MAFEHHDLRERIRTAALQLGFVRVGFARPSRLQRGDFLRDWVAAGNAASMRFMRDTWQLRDDPRQLLPEVETIVVCAARYSRGEDDAVPPEHGRIARYARGADYHTVLWQRLDKLHATIETFIGRPLTARPAVDTAPLLERELAMSAGVGFIGKNAMLITPGVGSYTVLGSLLIGGVALPPDEPASARCGRCTLCLDACPSSALRQPFSLDARRCISYLTIEHKGRIEIGPTADCETGGWVFGCDACQQVCPYNQSAASAGEIDAVLGADPMMSIHLPSLLRLRSGEYRRLTKQRALRRASAPTLRRSAALAAAQLESPTAELMAALRECADRDRDEAAREAARWTLEKLSASH